MHRGLIGLVVALAALVIACRDVSAPEPSLRIQTSDTNYVLDRSPFRPIPATVTNVSSQPITLAVCDSIVTPLSERWYDGRWSGLLVLTCGPLKPVRLQPGETRELDVRASILGRFRLRVPLFFDSTHQIPSLETSPAFNIL